MKFSVMAEETDGEEWTLQPETPSTDEPASDFLEVAASGSQDTVRVEDCQPSLRDNNDTTTTEASAVSHTTTGQQQQDRETFQADVNQSKPVRSLFQKIEDAVESIRELALDMNLDYEEIADALIEPERLREMADDQRRLRDVDEDTDLGPLHIAAKRNNTKIIQALLKNGADINARGGSNSTALHIAAWKGNFEALKILALHPDIDLDAVDRHGCTALTQAVRAGSFPCALLLVCKGADVDVVTAGRTALHWACATADMQELVKQLAAKSTKINLPDEYGDTALQVAFNTKNWDYVTPLIDAGADLNVKNRYGCPAMHQACLKAPADLLLDLVQRDDVDFTQRGNFGEVLLHLLCHRDLYQIAEIVIGKENTDVDAKTHWGSTPLMVAVGNNREKTVRMLVANHADVNVQDKGMETALTIAIERGHDDIAEFLIDSGSAVNPSNESVGRYRAKLDQDQQAEEVYAALTGVQARPDV